MHPCGVALHFIIYILVTLYYLHKFFRQVFEIICISSLDKCLPYYEATVIIRGRETTVKIGADKQKIKAFVYINK